MGATDTEALLADLEEQYKRSCFVLSQLEHSLTAHAGRTRADAGRPPMQPSPAVGAIEDLIEVDEFGQDEDEEEEAEEEALVSASPASSQPLGFLSPQAHVHQPEEVLPSSCVGGDNVSAPLRPRVSIIDMSSVALAMRRPPRRSASLYTLASTPLLPTTTPLQRRRAPGDTSRSQLPQQPSPIDVSSPSTSQSNTSFGPSLSIMLRLNSEILARGHRQTSATGSGGGGGAESPKSPKSPSLPSLPDIFAQPLRSASIQPQQGTSQSGGVSRLAQAMRNSLIVVGDPYEPSAAEPLPSPLPLSLPLPSQAQAQPQPQLQLVPASSGDGFVRRASISRRGSDYVFSPLGAASSHAGQQPQPPQPDSPRSACASPGAGWSTGLPIAATSPAGGSRAMRRSSCSNPPLGLRPSLASARSQALPRMGMDELQASAATAGAAAATDAASASGCDSEGGSPSPRASLGGSLPLVRLPAPLARTRSYSMLGLGAGPGLGTGPPALAAWPPATVARVGAAGSQRR